MNHSSRRTRPGITLMEVLISIFVLSVGLLGLMALFPISAFHLQEANKFDRGSALGRAGVRNLIVRDYLNPLNWRDVSGFPVVELRAFNNGGVSTTVPVFIEELPTPAPGLRKSISPPFVIDPLGVSHSANVQTSFLPGWCPVSPAPGTTLAAPIIRRLTVNDLRPPPSAPQPPISPPANDIRWTAAYSLAEQIFGGQDDRIFTLPEVGGRRPSAVNGWAWGPDGAWGVSGADDNGDGITDDIGEAGNGDDTLHRNSAGEYSFMVTVSPELEPVIDDTMGASGVMWRPVTSGAMVASAVVFRGRDFVLDPSVQADPPPERMVLLDLPATDTITTALMRTYGPASHLSPRRNEWIMVTAWVNDPTFPAPGQRPILYWYRVVHVGDLVAGASGFERVVTLDGPQLPVTSNLVDGDTATTATTVYATIFTGAIGVYEHSVQIGDPPTN